MSFVHSFLAFASLGLRRSVLLYLGYIELALCGRVLALERLVVRHDVDLDDLLIWLLEEVAIRNLERGLDLSSPRQTI